MVNKLVLLLIVLAVPYGVAADREGGYLSFAAGLAVHRGDADYDQPLVTMRSGDASENENLDLFPGPVYELKLGMVINAHNLVFWNMGQAFFDQGTIGLAKHYSYWGPGYRLYWNDMAPSPYAEIAIHHESLNFSADKVSAVRGADSREGSGYALAVGYEFSPRIQLAAFYHVLDTKLQYAHGTFYQISSIGLRWEYALSLPSLFKFD
ncbi:hypothetical protein [Gynuella sp.]|uniref:hypothetical protein n=1 Tax=Gynuella sp. TaxID=2969146 RepID=UPI003D1261AD